MTDPLERWLTTLGGYLDAQVTAVEGGWHVVGTSAPWQRFADDIGATDPKKQPLLIAAEPRDGDQWRDRLRVVERAAARQLTAAPVAFTATIPAKSKRPATRTIVRFAFGFSLSLGRRLRQRFTAYAAPGDEHAHYVAGDDALFKRGPVIAALDTKRPEVRNALPALLSAARTAQESYRNDAGVLAELDRLRGNYEHESQSVETLYTINSGQSARLLGMESKEMKSEDATESEYVSRLEDLAERFRPRVIFEPLTIGLIAGWDG